MTISGPRLRSLLRQARRLQEAGKLAAAEALYRQILEEAPETAAAWVGVAQLAREPAASREAFERALAIDPDNPIALAALDESSPEADVAAAPAAAAQAGEQDGSPPSESPLPAVAVAESPVPNKVRPQQSGRNEQGAAFELVTEGGKPFELVCYRHPGRTTSLRCYTCDRPICSECAVKTPVGYRCPICIREAEDTFFNARALDYVVAGLVALLLSLVAGFLVVTFGARAGIFFIVIMIFIGGAVGSLIGRLTKRAIGHRRGRYLPALVGTCVVLGVVIPAFGILLAILFGQFGALTLLIGPGVYLFTATSSAYYQMR